MKNICSPTLAITLSGSCVAVLMLGETHKVLSRSLRIRDSGRTKLELVHILSH